MTIALTWSNVVRAVTLTAVVLGLVLSAGVAVVQWQLDSLNARLVERLNIYHREQEQLDRRITRVESDLRK